MDLSNYLRFFAALVFVLALIGIATWLARRFGFGARVPAVRRGDRRLEVVEVLAVDAKHRAVLLRRDRTEHLVLLGPAGGVLVESGIDTASEALRAAGNAPGAPASPAPERSTVADTDFAPLIPGNGP